MSHRAVRGLAVLAMLSLAVLGLAVQGPRAVRAQEKTEVRMDFEATATRGPDAGFVLRGTLLLSIDPSGDLEGTLTTPDGQVIAVVGQATGRALSLLFDLGDGQEIFGTGVSQRPLRSGDPGRGGGSWVGLQPGDEGEWGISGSGGGGGTNSQ